MAMNTSYKDWVREARKSPGFVKAYVRLEPYYQLERRLIKSGPRWLLYPVHWLERPLTEILWQIREHFGWHSCNCGGHWK